MSHQRKLFRSALITTVAIALAGSLSGCSQLLDRIKTIDFETGSFMPSDATVGFHVALDDDWKQTAGDRYLGYAMFENDKLGCTLLSAVVTPKAALPHDLPDRAGSIALLEQFPAGAGGKISFVTYPVQGGLRVEMARTVTGTDDSANSVVLAREFQAIESAIYLATTCEAGTNADDVVREVLARDMPAIVRRES